MFFQLECWSQPKLNVRTSESLKFLPAEVRKTETSSARLLTNSI